jgi:hypothetical protein
MGAAIASMALGRRRAIVKGQVLCRRLNNGRYPPRIAIAYGR